MNAQEALAKLKDGNRRFTQDTPAPKKNGINYRKPLINGQQPYAVIIACSDSRVPPEIIFDTSINELFVIRNAGNVVRDVELASIEYALEHLHAALVVVLGHENCGAVNAVREIAATAGSCEGYFKSIYNEIIQSLTKEQDNIEYANARHSGERVLQSAVVRELMEKRGVKVCCAMYQLESGKVEFFDCA